MINVQRLLRMMFTIIAAALLLCALPNITGSEETKTPATSESQIQSIRDQLGKIDREVEGIRLTILTLMKAMLDSSSPSEIVAKIIQPDEDRAKLPMALAQCKVDWMNHPAARDDKSSAALSIGDYLAACMESHGYRHRLACLATPDSESCYDPTHIGGRYKALAQCKVDWMNHPAAREDKSSAALSIGDYLAACMESHGYRHRLACLATPDSASCYDPTNFATLLEDTPPFDAPRRRTTGATIDINLDTHSAEQREKARLDSAKTDFEHDPINKKFDFERRLDRVDSRLGRLESVIADRPGRYRPPSCERYDWMRW